jgi:hypothetical protein
MATPTAVAGSRLRCGRSWAPEIDVNRRPATGTRLGTSHPVRRRQLWRGAAALVCRSLCLPQGTKIIYWVRIIRSACLSGSCAGLASTAALAMAARTEGNAAVRPINATSHWLNGNSARSYQGFDAAHTAVGFLTNHIASIFWATFFDAWRARRAPVGPLPMLRDAMIMSAIAAAVDYGATPKKGMAIAYAGLVLGLCAGALWTQSGRRRRN